VTKVNSINIVDFVVEDESMAGSNKYFLMICAEMKKGQKGGLYFYQIVLYSLILGN
jgi:hypothetical protein